MLDTVISDPSSTAGRRHRPPTPSGTARGVGASPAPATPVAVSFPFFGFGLACFALLNTALGWRPDWLLGGYYRPEVLALAHGVILGWVGSFLFGAGYQIYPVVAEAPLWSRSLAAIHAVLHPAGVTGLCWSLLQMDFAQAGHWGSVVFLGMALFALNTTVTANRRSRWTPENLTLVAALFWLLVTGGLALFLLAAKFLPLTEVPAAQLMGLHAHYGLAGFFLLVLLGASLKLGPMFLVARARTSAWAWAGWALHQAGLLAFAPAVLLDSAAVAAIAAGLVATGTLAYLAEIIRLTRSRLRPIDWPMASFLLGLAQLPLPLGLAVWQKAGEAGWVREAPAGTTLTYVALALLGPFTATIFGMGARILPFLVWQLRYAPLVGRRSVPRTADLTRPAWHPLVTGALGLAWLALAVGLLGGLPGAIRLAALAHLAALAGFLLSLRPLPGHLRAVRRPAREAPVLSEPAAPTPSPTEPT